MTALNDVQALEAAVRRTVAETTVTDIHTHLFPPSHDDLLLWGVDELLTYHYLVAELFTVAPRAISPGRFWDLSKREQADLIWEHLFLRRGPLSEATRGVVTVLATLGLDAAGRDLAAVRRWFEQQSIDVFLPRVFETANIDYAVMTNNPFVAEEAACWNRGLPVADCLRAALRIDTMILDWPNAAVVMRDAGHDAAVDLDRKSVSAARHFLADWSARMRPVYLAASLSPSFTYPAETRDARVVREVVLPAAKDLGLPVALMIGARKGVNPALRDGGDGVGVANVEAVMHLCQQNPDVKFLVTMLSRVNQHELTVLARKFGNLHLFGCWWFLNDPSMIEEMTRMRVELLGTAFTCQHSDARVLDQLLYKWAHTRAAVADVLAEKFRLQFAAGWRATEEEIRHDVRALFGGSFAEFLAK